MLAITSTALAYSAGTRYDIENNNSSKNNRNANEPLSPADRVPQREVDLNQELDRRLSGEITRIRRQINPNTAYHDPQKDIGRRVDISA